MLLLKFGVKGYVVELFLTFKLWSVLSASKFWTKLIVYILISPSSGVTVNSALVSVGIL